jgi:DNA-binding NarL/FixJ family response regulator
MPVHLSEEEVVTIRILAEKGQKKSEIARAMNVTEGTVRYHKVQKG